LLGFIRLILGPTTAGRVVAADTLAGPVHDLFEYLANEETEHKRELEKTYYQLIHSCGPGNAS
jgi:hypothetical protein